MKRNKILTIPNVITLLGMLCVLVSAYLVYDGRELEAFYFFLLVILSDYLDGWSARFIEKRNSGNGISRFGEVFDPVRDKSVILIVLAFDYEAAVLIVVAETISTIYANLVRDAKKEHYVPYASKTITFLQAIIISVMFFIPEDARTLIFGIAILSFGRFLTYFSEYRTIAKKQKIPLI